MKKLMKTLTVLMCAVALVAGSVAGTFAWLTAKTDPITNTFTAGNINITLEGSTVVDNKMVPGKALDNNSKVTVTGGSEDCWLFIKVEKTANFNTFMSYTMVDGWAPVDGADGVYSRVVTSNQNAQEFLVFSEIQALSSAKKADYDLLGTEGNPIPCLTLTAYAVQQVGFATAAVAWDEAKLLG